MGRRRVDSGATGMLVVDKPAGCTSHDVVDQLRRRLGTRKVGHAGTLDPDATGVLVIGVGRGTKLLQFLTGADKRYWGELVLGATTTTLDSSGEIVERFAMHVTPDQVAEAAQSFVGDIDQIPPMVSAVKVGGQRLHELARRGELVDRPSRRVTVHSLEVTPTDDSLRYQMSVHCSSGTYIRSLAADLGAALGGGAHLHGLRRTAVGRFTEDQAEPVGEAPLRPAIDLLGHLPRLEVDAIVADQVRHGRSLGPSRGSGPLAIVDEEGTLLAVYEPRDGEFRPIKVLVG